MENKVESLSKVETVPPNFNFFIFSESKDTQEEKLYF